MTLREKWSPEVREGYYNKKFWTPFITKLLVDMAAAFSCHVHCESWPTC